MTVQKVSFATFVKDDELLRAFQTIERYVSGNKEIDDAITSLYAFAGDYVQPLFDDDTIELLLKAQDDLS